MNSADIIILISLITMGFFGGFSHCVGMCGPFVLTQVSNNLSHTPLNDFQGLKKLSKIALFPYHLGRITTYSLIGFICALLRINLDKNFSIEILSALLMLVACGVFVSFFITQNSLKIHKIFQINLKFLPRNFLKKLNFLSPFFKIFTKKINFLLINSTGLKGYLLGLILGFIPCGMLYGAFALASSLSNPFLAFLGMFLFGTTTFFALFFVGFFAKLTFKLPEFKIIANIVIIINIVMLFKMFLKKIF
jgi:sulfite exporter TauE/SafE